MADEPRDLARYLPLSIRPRVDESRVTDDWAARLDQLALAVPYAGAAFDAAVARARAGRRVRIADLGAALVEAYMLGDVDVDDVTSGAVALARAVAAPLPVRAVVRGSTLRATDADWSFGSGPEIAGTARELVLFLYGRGPVPSA
ncbi:MAG: hypothetical protein ABI566_05980 [Pseudolysinimonas sp.]